MCRSAISCKLTLGEKCIRWEVFCLSSSPPKLCRQSTQIISITIQGQGLRQNLMWLKLVFCCKRGGWIIGNFFELYFIPYSLFNWLLAFSATTRAICLQKPETNPPTICHVIWIALGDALQLFLVLKKKHCLVQYWSALSSIPHTHSPGYVLFLPTVPPQLALTWIPFLMGPCNGRMLNLQLSYALMCTFFMTFHLISWWSITPHSFCPHRTQPDYKQAPGHTELFAMRSEMVWVSFLDKHFYCTTLTEISNYSHSTPALSAPL